MEPFYDGDLKDIWDSDLDPTDSLKISTDSDISDWFLEREVKDPTVILNDKLISDALFIGTVPIKSEHSYSLNSDGDSQPNSPKSLHTKMDDMEDECYPAISLKTATSNLRHHSLLLNHPHTATIDPKCLTISTSSFSAMSTSSSCTSSAIFTTSNAPHSLLSSNNTTLTSSNSPSNTATYTYHNNGNIFAGLNKLASAPMTVNLRSLESHNASGDTLGGTLTFASKQLPLQQHQLQQHQQQLQQQNQIQQQQQHHHLQQQQQHNLPHMLSALNSSNIDSECHSPMSSSRDGSISPDICSDIEIDETCIKDEPMSPDSSCPPSPNTTGAAGNGGRLTLNMANMAAFTKSDLVFEHKDGCLQLTPASQSLLKSQQVILANTSAANGTTVTAAVNSQNIIIPKFNIKTELKTVNGATTGTFITTASSPLKNAKMANGGVYGLPLTPPSSLPSDDSEGNLTPEHLLSPLSPNNSAVSINNATGGAVNSLVTTPASSSTVTARRSTSSSSSSSSSHGGGGNSHHHHHRGGINSGGGGSTRQPIHTPLISSQPKGSTGTLILTEEEKRTLLAEGYPIPQKLPLTKAEEKSLKKIRRKIKNKISAQESRRKKKEYMDQLERRVEILVGENNDYRKRVELLEDSNANLLSQLQKMQALLNKQNVKK